MGSKELTKQIGMQRDQWRLDRFKLAYFGNHNDNRERYAIVLHGSDPCRDWRCDWKTDDWQRQSLSLICIDA
ncbi:hypothetical protein RHGRI_003357 [Rhododendron griersonianum]|uniref:Uncharacterized protein n=1 Tax=Rhododendron griersonianum TaxID=479676 RepID=A0AAV6L6P3_9ERIC|nr:hypothetical protein RHGRI_003357 [Rhododendron griersonianum]